MRMRRPVRIPKHKTSPEADVPAFDLSDLAAKSAHRHRERPRRRTSAPFPSHLAGALCALADTATAALEYRTAAALHAEMHSARGPRQAGQGSERESVPRLWTGLAARLRARLERPIDRGYPCLARDLRAVYARFCGPRLWRGAAETVAPLFLAVARGEISGEQIVDLVDAALGKRGGSEETAARVRRRLSELTTQGCQRSRTRSGGRPAPHTAPPCGVGRAQTWVCLDCGEITEQPRPVPLYECAGCGEHFTAPADSSRTAVPHCAACQRRGIPIADACCPACQSGELEELEMVVCPECGAHVVPSDWACHWREHAGARP